MPKSQYFVDKKYKVLILKITSKENKYVLVIFIHVTPRQDQKPRAYIVKQKHKHYMLLCLCQESSRIANGQS